MIYPIDIYNHLTSALNKLNVQYLSEVPGQMLGGRFSIAEGLGQTQFHLIVGNDYVSNQTYLTSEQVPYTWPMIDFINRANQSMIFGNFEFFFSNVTLIRFRYSLPWAAIVDENLQTISALVRTPSMMFARFLPGMRLVARGTEVGEAIRLSNQR